MGDYLPRFKPGHTPTIQLTTDAKGGQLLELTGNNTAGVAAAGSTKVIGVCGPDGKAGDYVAYHRDGIQRLKLSGTVAAGAPLQPAADGTVVSGSTPKIAMALQAGNTGDVVDAAWA